MLHIFWENFGKNEEKWRGNCKNTTTIILRISGKENTAVNEEKHCSNFRETLLHLWINFGIISQNFGELWKSGREHSGRF